jgi:DNA-binding response OmpR family regulator
MARVLLVEDEPSVAGLITFKLRREGHEVRCESDAQTAAAAASAFRPEVAVLDTGLDHGTGGGRYGLIGALAERCSVLAVTELHDDAATVQAMRQGASTIKKPFKPTVLARAVADLAEGRTTRA